MTTGNTADPQSTLAPVLMILGTATMVAGVVLFTPWIVGFGAAVAAAIGWCLWLERHPE
jgi:hypothetical protein